MAVLKHVQRIFRFTGVEERKIEEQEQFQAFYTDLKKSIPGKHQRQEGSYEIIPKFFHKVH